MPEIAGTLQTDPRSGGIKRSSGVNILPAVADAWKEVRDDTNKDVDWIIIGYVDGSKTDMTLLEKGNGGLDVVSTKLRVDSGEPIFGGVKLLSKNRFVQFLYIDDSCPAMKRGRTLMYKNGVYNVLEGCDGQIEITPNMKESDVGTVK
jgi:hypothetical protein